jgi:hypothetical protein
MLIQFVVRTIGPVLLRGGLGGGNTASTDTQSSKKDDFDDFDDFDDNNEVEDKNKSAVSISLPTFAPDSVESSVSSSSSAVAESSADVSKPNDLDPFDEQSSTL